MSRLWAARCGKAAPQASSTKAPMRAGAMFFQPRKSRATKELRAKNSVNNAQHGWRQAKGHRCELIPRSVFFDSVYSLKNCHGPQMRATQFEADRPVSLTNKSLHDFAHVPG